MNRIEFERNTPREALQDAKNWLEDNDVRVKDIVVHELYADGFGSWEVVIYYERNA
jgi:hypothetical protein